MTGREKEGVMSTQETQVKAMHDVLAERARQDRKWGEQNNDPFVYLTVLSEEVGELAQAALHTRFGGDKADGLYTEAVHTAAVALAIVECLLRDKWKWGVANDDGARSEDAGV
jgi:hypothetical protein